MSNLLVQPFRPTLNLAGKFEAGATMVVYKSGTSVLQPIFEDEELTTRLPNPLTADGFGVFPPVYFDENQPIGVTILEDNGISVFEVDPYISTVFEAEQVLASAVAFASDANTSATLAEDFANRAATSEAIATAFAGPSYASTAAGIAATVDGEFFYVLNSGTVEVYLNVSETAVLQYSILSASAVTALIAAKANTVHTHNISEVTGLQAAIDAKAPLASPAFTGTPTTGGIEIGYRNIPRRTTTTTAVAGDRGGCVAISAGFTIPNAVFSAGDAISIYNDSASSVTITQGSGLTLRQAATTNTGNRTLAARGIATIWFNTASEAIISGPGVT